MRLFKNIYFINSASIPFAKINVSGNIHLTGSNGSGKSSILRAIVFFYNSDTQNLGIEGNKKNFVDFYFPDINSYIVYEIQKENLIFLVIAFKKQNRVNFKIIESEFQKENFFENNQVMTYQDILKSFYKEKKTVHNKTFDTYKEFKSLVYGNNNEYKRYSLFEGKGINYQNIPRTIQNIFLNSKLDSTFMKSSIINSIMETSPYINLSILKNKITDFSKNYDEINKFHNNKNLSTNIIKTYNQILDFEKLEKELSYKLGYRAKNISTDKKNIALELYELENKITSLKREITNKNLKFKDIEEKLTFNIKSLAKNIEISNNKKIEYKKMNIDNILKEVENKDNLVNALNNLKREELIIKNEILDIHQKYDLMKRNLSQSINEKKNSLDEKINTIEKDFLINKESIKDETSLKINKIELKYNSELENINKDIKLSQTKIFKLKSELNEINYSQPLKEELDESNKKYKSCQNEIINNNSKIDDLENKVTLLNKDKEYLTKEKESELKQIEKDFKKQSEELNNIFNNLENKLENSSESFSAFLEKNYPDYDNNIAKVLSEEIIFSTELEPEIKEINTLFFGIQLNLSSLPKAKTLTDYKQLLEDTKNDIEKLRENFDIKFQEIKKKHDELIESKSKKIRDLEKDILKFKKELEQRKIILSNLEISIKKITEDSNNIKNKLLNDKDIEVKSETNNLKKLEEYENSIKHKRKEELNLLRKFETDEIANKNKNHEDQKDNLKRDFELFSNEINEKINNYKIEYNNERKNRNIDNNKLNSIENEIINIEKKLDFIEKNTKNYYSYINDKTNYFDKENSFIQDKNNFDNELSNKKIEFEKDISNINFEIDKLTKSSDEYKSTLKNLENDIIYFEDFKNNEIFSKISTNLSDEAYFIQNEESIINLIQSITNTKTKVLEKTNNLKEKINRYLDNFESNNIFNFKKNIYTDNEFIETTKIIKDFIEEEKILELEKLISSNYNLIMRELSKQIKELISKEEDVKKVIKQINNSFEKTKNISVIKEISLRYKESNNKIIYSLQKIKDFVDENLFAGEFNLFNQSVDTNSNDQKAIKLLKQLKISIEETKHDTLPLEEAFEIEFKIQENNNSTGFIEKLSNIGSNGTDVLVKSMIYITLLDSAKSKIKIQNFKIHCIIDEVGILDNKYLKYLIDFANEKDILLINASPNHTEKFIYNSAYRVIKDNETNNSIVKTLIEAKFNETTT